MVGERCILGQGDLRHHSADVPDHVEQGSVTGIRQVEQAMHRRLALVAESIQSYKGRSLRETAEAGHDNRAGDLYAKRSHFHTDRVQVPKAPNSNTIGCQDDGCLAFSQTQHGICKPGSTKLLSSTYLAVAKEQKNHRRARHSSHFYATIREGL